MLSFRHIACRITQNSIPQRDSHSSNCSKRGFCTASNRIWQEFRSKHRPVWAEVNLDNVAHNVQSLRAKLPKSSTLIAVVKADGYGHGAVQVGKAALEGGAQRLAVAVVEEGISIRRSKVLPESVEIHVLGLSAPGTEKSVLEHNLIPTVAEVGSLKRFVEASKHIGFKTPVRYHLKIDTGMGRIGILPRDLDRFLSDVITSATLSRDALMEGVYTHFSKADELDKSHTKAQVELFGKCVQQIRSHGISPSLVHSANSAGIIDSSLLYDSGALDLTNTYRMGISLYGLYPSPDVDFTSVSPLKPVLTWKTEIIQLKELEPGQTISYGGEYVTSSARTTKIATLPIGYADGFRRRLGRSKLAKPSFHVLVRGQEASIVGRVCMDMCHIDVTHIPNVSPGDEVVLIGRQGDATITAEQMASKLKTINYEITCLIGRRVPRIYVKNGSVVGLKSIISETNL